MENENTGLYEPLDDENSKHLDDAFKRLATARNNVIDLYAEALNRDLIRPERRSGNTTRMVDLAIQLLFEGNKIRILDHYLYDEGTWHIEGLIFKRLEIEHDGLLRRNLLSYHYKEKIMYIKKKENETDKVTGSFRFVEDIYKKDIEKLWDILSSFGVDRKFIEEQAKETGDDPINLAMYRLSVRYIKKKAINEVPINKFDITK